MAQRGGGGGARGGGRGRAKNRPAPYTRPVGGAWEPARGHGSGELAVATETAEPPSGPLTSGPGEGGASSQEDTPPPLGMKKFANKARLFFGNLPRDFSEQELTKMLAPYGEVQEIYHNKEKNFAFARMAYRSQAEQVIMNHNGQRIRTRDIKVRFAASSSSVKVSNLNPYVSNELLAEAFSHFGDVEEAFIATDDRGKPLGYGVVDFARKGQAMSAIQQCKKEPFLLTHSPVPVVVAEMVRDNEEGIPERLMVKNPVYYSERQVGPRFAQHGTLEYEVAVRWKSFFEQEKIQRAQLEERLQEMKAAIENDTDTIKQQHQTVVLRQEIARHQLEQQRLAERLREQEQRLKGLNTAQTNMGLLPSFSGPAPLFPPIVGDSPRPPPEGIPPGDMPPPNHMGPLMPPPPPHMGGPLFMTPPPPLMGQKPR